MADETIPVVVAEPVDVPSPVLTVDTPLIVVEIVETVEVLASVITAICSWLHRATFETGYAQTQLIQQAHTTLAAHLPPALSPPPIDGAIADAH